MILITGAARHLGRAIALKLASRKHPLVLHYRSSKREAESLAAACKEQGCEVVLLQGDFSTQEGVKDFTTRYLSYSFETKGLINNVGNYHMGPASRTTEEEWCALFQTNLHTPFFLSRALLPSLKKSRGRIVNIGTVGLKGMRGNTHATAYTLSKAGLALFTLSLAKEVASDLVTVNMVSPGYLENSEDSGPMPMGRGASMEEVAHTVAFLFEPEAAYITGQNIEVAGGVAL